MWSGERTGEGAAAKFKVSSDNMKRGWGTGKGVARSVSSTVVCNSGGH